MGRFIEVGIPATRDPFVNSQLVPAGFDKDTGEERFWASTWNSVSGCTGVLITGSGKNRVYRFDYERKQFGYYGASYAGDDIMYLSGFLDEVVKLDLATGETVSWNTGLPHALSTSGMVYDDATGKVFSTAYCQGDYKRKGFSFSTGKREVQRLYEDIPFKNNQLRCAVKNNDGTYTFSNIIPEFELLKWDPQTDDISIILESIKTESHSYNYCVLIKREDGAIYIPEKGWFDPIKQQFVSGPKALREAAWFALRGTKAYGAEQNDSGNVTLLEWEIDSGAIREIAGIPDSTVYNFRMTAGGKILCVNLYGFFYRVDPEKSAIECSVRLDTDSIGHIDCIHRISEYRLLCTPFITQRFYEIDLKTGEGTDLGRATGGFGEVLELAELNGKIYMASYTKGHLVEYDPKRHAAFPENPRLMVTPPYGAMRPVGMCADNEHIYYSCSHEYGFLGSVMTKHSPAKGTTDFINDPVKNQMIRKMYYDSATGTIIAGTTTAADCNSCPPVSEAASMVKLDAASLKTINVIEAPQGVYDCSAVGKLEDDVYLFRLSHRNGKVEWMKADSSCFEPVPYVIPDAGKIGNCVFHYAGKPGYFILDNNGSVELWDLAGEGRVREICREKGYYRMFVQNNSLYFVYREMMHIYDNCLF